MKKHFIFDKDSNPIKYPNIVLLEALPLHQNSEIVRIKNNIMVLKLGTRTEIGIGQQF